MPTKGYSKKTPRKKAAWKPKKLTAKAKQKWAIRKAQEEREAKSGIDPEGCGHMFENLETGGSACIFCKTFMYAQLRVTGAGELQKEFRW